MYSNSTSGKSPSSEWIGRTNPLNLKENETLEFSSKPGDAKFSDRSNALQRYRAPNCKSTSMRSTHPESGIERSNSNPFQSIHVTNSKVTDQKSSFFKTNPDGVPGSTTSSEKLREKVSDSEESKIKSMELSNLTKNDAERADERADKNDTPMETNNFKEIQPQNELPSLAVSGSTDLVSKFKGRGPTNAIEAAASTIFTNPVYAQKFVASGNLLDLATTILKNDLDNTLAQIETSNQILQDSLELK